MNTNPQRYRHRTAEIEAVQWTGSNADQLAVFCSPFDFQLIDPEDRVEDPDQTAAVRESAHGTWRGLAPGDWVVKRGKGVYELSAADFAERYEPVVSSPSAARADDRAAEAVQYWFDAATERRTERDRLRAVVARVRQMADYWEQQLPEVIRTPAVVSALRAALEAADGPSRMADEAQQPACSDPIECSHEAALGQAEAKLDNVQALAMAWSRPSMSAPTRVAGEHLKRLLADEAQQQPESETQAAATLARDCTDHASVILWCADRVRAVDDDPDVQDAADYLHDLSTRAQVDATPVTDRGAVIRWCAQQIHSMGGNGSVERAADYLDDLATEAEGRCTCGSAGDGFVPLGHYRDCPAAAPEPHPTEADMRHALAVAATFHGQEADRPSEVVHGCPPDGSGLTPCCGRTPFELPLGDRISSEAPVTCPGGAVSQPGKEA